MNELERMLADSASRLFADAVTPARIDAMEHGLWQAELWDQVEASGLTRLFVPEADEGAQASWTEGLPVLLAGANAPAPFLDTVVAGWVLHQLGVTMPGGPIALADLAVPVSACLHGDGWALDGAVAVPWGRYVGHVLIRAIDAETRAPLWLLAATGAAAVETGVNLANEPRDRLTFPRVPDSAAVRGDPAGWPATPQALGALTRAIGIAGLLERILNQTVQYANERTQFGRPIGKFQAVQQQLAILANETVAARMAVASACAAVDAGDWTQAAMVAKVICGQSAGRAAAIAHQVHGAIGFTHEHSLHQSTRRVWAWRGECGTEAHWAAEIGRRAIARGGDALWADLTAAAA